MEIKESIYISALKGGSYEAFSVLYKKYADMLYSFALTHSKNQSVAQDIVQDTFMRLWKNRESLQTDGNIKALLFTIARNRLIDCFRQQLHQVSFEEYMTFCEQRAISSSPEEKIYFDEFMERYQRCKTQLSGRESEIFEMSREQNIPINLIAETLNLSPQTVKNYITSVLKIFRHNLQKEQF